MRNRDDGADSPGWWDDLPPKVRERFGTLPADDPVPAAPARPVRRQSTPAARPSALDWVRELSRLALLFLAVAVANIFFLLVALSFIASGPVRPAAPFAAPAR